LSDGFGGAMLATQHLLALGHRRIAFVYNEPNAPSFVDRRRGYLCALWEAGIVPDPAWIVSVSRREPLEPHLLPLLTGSNAPTAVVAANDWNAFVVLATCRNHGLSVPGDVSVIGFDDISFSGHSYPPLTTVRVEKAEMGRLAIRRLLARIAEAQTETAPAPAISLIAPVSLVERESCAPPNR
jgi:LacI family transcriptional regulator